MKLDVEFGRPRHGWLPLKMAAEGFTLELTASYLIHDPVEGLASALALRLKGGDEATVSWNEEPTDFEFRFTAVGPDTRLRITRFPDDDRRKGSGVKLFDTTGPTADLCLPFWRALRRLETARPPNEYKAAWGHHFPSAKVAEIKALLDQHEEKHS